MTVNAVDHDQKPKAHRPRFLARTSYITTKLPYKTVAVEMTRCEVSQLMDIFKRIFAWKPTEWISASQVIGLPYFAACQAEAERVSESHQMSGEVADMRSASQAESDVTISQHGNDRHEALVSLCGIGPLLAMFHESLRPYDL